jgi:peptidoglycan/xylan/chitin deacetylase (PgdA/CDA1 family)
MQSRLDTLSYRFAFHQADEVFRQAVLTDARAARLSLAFRAYYHLRPLLPLRLRQLLQRCRPVHTTGRWWFPDDFIGRLSDKLAGQHDVVPIIHPWPDGADFAFVLTHDVDTADGMANVARIADIEQGLGFRSSWNVVPYKYRVDHGLLRDLQARGFEIGVHGYNHDGTLYLSKRIFEERVPGINAALKSFGAVGFRSPMVHRNLAWLQMLDIEYDASCFDVDPYQAMPGGVGSIWPFVAGKFVELPYTLPQDHTVFIALGTEDGTIWREKFDYLVRRSGMVLMLTHPDYLDSSRRLEVYREFLEHTRECCGGWHSLPREVADWWRQRERSTLEKDGQGTWQVRGPASGRATEARISVGNGHLRIHRLTEWHGRETGERSSPATDYVNL